MHVHVSIWHVKENLKKKHPRVLHVMLSAGINLISRDSVLPLQRLLINTAIWPALISLTVNYLNTKFGDLGKI